MYTNSMQRSLFPEGVEIGVDEAGRGCLFGPVTAGAVVLNPDIEPPSMITDSKKLTPKKREEAAIWVREHALAYSVCHVSAQEIDDTNILMANMKAMASAIAEVFSKVPFDRIVVDGNYFQSDVLPDIPRHVVVKGDAKFWHIAAASILAKTERDRYIKEQCEHNPNLLRYGMPKNAGYGTKAHMEAVRALGPTKGHRMTFSPCKENNFLMTSYDKNSSDLR